MVEGGWRLGAALCSIPPCTPTHSLRAGVPHCTACLPQRRKETRPSVERASAGAKTRAGGMHFKADHRADTIRDTRFLSRLRGGEKRGLSLGWRCWVGGAGVNLRQNRDWLSYKLPDLTEAEILPLQSGCNVDTSRTGVRRVTPNAPAR